MSIVYSDAYAGSIQNTTFSGTSRTVIADQVKAVLVAAGWNATGSSGTWTCSSHTSHPNGFICKVKIWDPGSGNCCRIALLDAGGRWDLSSAASGNGFLYPQSETWRVLAGPFQAFIFVDGSAVARKFCAFGAPYTPSSFETSPASFDHISWLQNNASSDTDTTVDPSLRTILQQAGNGQCGSGNFSTSTPVQILGSLYTGCASQWLNGKGAAVFAPMLGATMSAGTRLVGYLWDSFVITKNVAMDTVFTYDSKTWHAISSDTGDRNFCVRRT